MIDSRKLIYVNPMAVKKFADVKGTGEYDLGDKSPRGKITSPLKLLYELGVKKCCQGLHCQFGVNN